MRVLVYAELKPKKGLPYSRQWISQLERRGQFPQRVSLGAGRLVGWIEEEIDEHIRNLPRGSSFQRPAGLEQYIRDRSRDEPAPDPSDPAPGWVICANPDCGELFELPTGRGRKPKFCPKHTTAKRRPAS